MCVNGVIRFNHTRFEGGKRPSSYFKDVLRAEGVGHWPRWVDDDGYVTWYMRMLLPTVYFGQRG